jgi:D-alanyl-D-alanine carboxypeptidase
MPTSAPSCVRSIRCAAALFLAPLALPAQPATTELPAALQGKIDDLARDTLRVTGVPSASIAVVRAQRVVYTHAYGDARLEPRAEAQPSMRYGIGSISKQFTATALLMLAEEGKLSLDDPLAKFLPNLTRAKDVTLRHLLSHTSGYQDYWPQDYVMPSMLHDATAQEILDGWARKPLDFEPGAQWQYSNTGYVIAGLIVERVSGLPLFTFLQQRVFTPLGMRSAFNLDEQRLPGTDARGYIRYALGPARPAPKEGKGWLFAAGGLAMIAEDLAKWDISILQQRLLKPASYGTLAKEVMLNNGRSTHYALGLSVGAEFNHRALQHGGEVSGFCSHNLVFPDDGIAIVVFTNRDATSAASTLAHKIGALILGAPENIARPNSTARPPAAVDPRILDRHRAVFTALQHGQIDRALFTPNCNSYFSAEALQDFAQSLGPLGAPVEFSSRPPSPRGGLMTHVYFVKFAERSVEIIARVEPDGKIEQFQVAAVE